MSGRRKFLEAALSAPIAIAPIAPAEDVAPDAAFIRACKDIIAAETEQWLLVEHDEYATDFGPNYERYERLSDETQRAQSLIDFYAAPITTTGMSYAARVALMYADYDQDGKRTAETFQDGILQGIAQNLAGDFVWPPRPDSYTQTHWAPAPSAAEVAAFRAADTAGRAEQKARENAEAAAKAAERKRLDTPSLLSETELRDALSTRMHFKTLCDDMVLELDAEMVRRGLA